MRDLQRRRCGVLLPLMMSLLVMAACGGGGSQTEDSGSTAGDRSDSRVRMGLALIAEGHVDAAMEQFHRLAAQGGERVEPGSEPEWVAPLVQHLLRRRALVTADSLLEAAGSLEERSDQLLYLTANLRVLQGRGDEALAAYALVSGNDELMGRVHHEMASVHLNAGRQEDALAEADLALDRSPDDSSLHLLKAEAYRQLDRLDDALASCRRVQPGSDRWVMEGEIYLNSLDRPDTARVLFERAMQDTPSIPNIRFLLGRALLAEGNASRARKAIEPLARRRPPFPGSRAVFAQCLRAVGKDAAADSLQAILDAEEQHERWSALRAEGLQESADGQLEAALLSFDRALELAPTNANLHNDRGAVLARLERWDAAEVEFEEAARLAPDDPTFLENLARLYHRTGEIAKRDAVMEKWRELRAAPADSTAKVDNR